MLYAVRLRKGSLLSARTKIQGGDDTLQRAPPARRRKKMMKNKEIKKRRAIKNTILYTVVGVALLSAIMSLYSLLRMAWSWKEFAVLMPVFLISVTILILFFYANDGFADDYEIMMYYDEEDELDEDE